MTDNAKVAAALRSIGEGIYELADALLDQPGPSAASPTKASSPLAATAAGSPAPADLPPSFDELPPEWAEPLGPAMDDIGRRIDATPERVLRLAGDTCPDHDLAWEVVPGGVSKRTGKPYTAFWHCPSFSCKQKPEKEWQDSHPAGRAA